MRIARDITWLVGRTPLVDLHRFAPDLPGRLVAKLEAFNPTSSNKDRAAVAMLDHAERNGFLEPGATVIECSAGDTGLALAMVCAVRRYPLILTMPADAPSRRGTLIRVLGATVELTEPDRGIRGAMQRAEELHRSIPGSLILQPFSNRANAHGHRTTATEIWDDTDGTVRAVVCPVGSGGTAAGCIGFFREIGADVRTIAVEPAQSPVLAGGAAGAHGIPGLGAGFVPAILCAADLDEIVPVDDTDACAAVRALARTEGILTGPASGAVLHAARSIAGRDDSAGQTIVAILPDDGERNADHAALAVDLEEPPK